MLSDQAGKAWDTFYDAARNSGVLDEKTTLLIHLSAAMSSGCYP